MSKYLLDVNALVAWGQQRSPQHAIFHAWARQQPYADLMTCGQVELGFIRISMQVFGDTLADAQVQLAALTRFTGGFIRTAPSPKLATWATRASLTSDAYLMQVAASSGLTLATFDASIPGAMVIR